MLDLSGIIFFSVKSTSLLFPDISLNVYVGLMVVTIAENI